ncbi:MAG: hypothetical protein LBI45_08225 [Bacteroidales bacterium]|jgi:hypothetical protein|nr:hypothetical protein [Bacteroidales bacterium]
MFKNIFRKQQNVVVEQVEYCNEETLQDIKNEEIAAITMGLHLFLNSCRDEESEVITIDMPSAHYSPWALKSLVMKRVVKR